MIDPLLPLGEVFGQINLLTRGDPTQVITVKEIASKTGINYSENLLGCLKYFAQKNYIEFTNPKPDLNKIQPTDSFSIHANGITALLTWNNTIPPKFPFF